MIEIKNLSFQYGKKEIFSDLNLSIQAGNIYGLLGRNGAGKTTLLKLIAGLCFPKSGECELFGAASSMRLPSVLRETFFIPEEFSLPSIRINQYEERYTPFYPNFNKEEFQQYLNEFSLSEDAKLNKISYGQKKQFLIAFALASHCKLVIMDEPTNGLDIPSKKKF